MNDLTAQFQHAVEAVREVPKRPDNDTLLEMYALYKQAVAGDASGPQPGFFDYVGCSKREAWEKLSGLPSDEAKRRYIDLVRSLGVPV